MGVSLSKLIQDIMSLMGDVIHQVNQSPTCTSIYHSLGGGGGGGGRGGEGGGRGGRVRGGGGFESVFACWFTNLSWHISRIYH